MKNAAAQICPDTKCIVLQHAALNDDRLVVVYLVNFLPSSYHFSRELSSTLPASKLDRLAVCRAGEIRGHYRLALWITNVHQQTD
jgi:hypothetical protein